MEALKEPSIGDGRTLARTTPLIERLIHWVVADTPVAKPVTARPTVTSSEFKKPSEIAPQEKVKEGVTAKTPSNPSLTSALNGAALLGLALFSRFQVPPLDWFPTSCSVAKIVELVMLANVFMNCSPWDPAPVWQDHKQIWVSKMVFWLIICKAVELISGAL